MEAQMNAVETTGTVDEQSQLHLDTPLPIQGPANVRVIVLYPAGPEEWDEPDWLRSAAGNPVFDFLKEPEEDVYTPADGKPFNDKV